MQSVHSGADQIQPHDNTAVGIDLEYLRRIRFVRQVVQDAGNTVPDVIDRSLYVPIEVKFHRNVRDSITAFGINGANAFDSADRIFNQLGHACLDDRSGRTGVTRFHGDYRRIDIRILPDRQTSETDNTEHYQQQAQH